VRGRDAEPARQALDIVDTVGSERRSPFSLRIGDIAGGISCLAAISAQRTKRFGQQGDFLVAQTADALLQRFGFHRDSRADWSSLVLIDATLGTKITDFVDERVGAIGWFGYHASAHPAVAGAAAWQLRGKRKGHFPMG
jgi:hypothetical protein